MTPICMVLHKFDYQNTVSGPSITNYSVTHDAITQGQYFSLPLLYYIAFAERKNARTQPYGGFIVKTNIDSKNTEVFKKMILDKDTPLELDF